MKFEYNIIKSKRKTLSIHIKNDLSIVVKSPLFVKNNYIDSFVKSHEKWISDRLSLIENRIKNKPSEEEIKLLKIRANDYISARAWIIAENLGVVNEITNIKITSAETRWGSCNYRNGKNSLCFSYKTMTLEKDLIDYIIIHEICHVKVKNHSKLFYKEIEKIIPDYKDKIKRINER